MKGGTVQINWHLTKPVLSLDFHPLSSTLATAGADFDIKLWAISSDGTENKLPTASYQTSLTHHTSAVNVVRFSPSGEQIASGADGGELLLWKLCPSESGQTWKVFKTLAFHRKDVLDLEWSTDGAYLISGSVDNSCLIWDANKGSVLQILDAHFHYVQGVAWDPLAKYVASLSSDRTCRVYVNKPQGKVKGPEKLNFVCQHLISKAELPSEGESKSTKSHLFHDETLPSFFRRLAWSPDGSFLLVPAGCYKTSQATETINTAYIFSRRDLSRPALQLPCANKPVVAVRFCPLRFTLRESSTSGFFKLPYRFIYAVATLNSLFVYDTESIPPLAVWAGLHYAAITDIAWSSDASYIAVSSQDGYCTIVEFENGELGTPILSEKQTVVTGLESRDPVQMPAGMEIDIDVAPSCGTIEEKGIETVAETSKDTRSIPKNFPADKSDGTPILASPTLLVPPSSISTIPNNRHIVESGSKMEVDKSDGKSVSASPTPILNKPAKRRITPIAVDP